MKVPTEAERAHIYAQVENATDTTTAEFLVGTLPTSEDDRPATRKDVATEVQLAKKDLELLVKDVELLVSNVQIDLTERITALQATTAKWMLTLLIAILGAMAAVYFAP